MSGGNPAPGGAGRLPEQRIPKGLEVLGAVVPIHRAGDEGSGEGATHTDGKVVSGNRSAHAALKGLDVGDDDSGGCHGMSLADGCRHRNRLPGLDRTVVMGAGGTRLVVSPLPAVPGTDALVLDKRLSQRGRPHALPTLDLQPIVHGKTHALVHALGCAKDGNDVGKVAAVQNDDVLGVHGCLSDSDVKRDVEEKDGREEALLTEESEFHVLPALGPTHVRGPVLGHDGSHPPTKHLLDRLTRGRNGLGHRDSLIGFQRERGVDGDDGDGGRDGQHFAGRVHASSVSHLPRPAQALWWVQLLPPNNVEGGN